MNILDVFAKDVFTDEEMRKRLRDTTYKKLKKTIQDGAELDAGIADEVAMAMKNWAVEHGATHYTHWFTPLTGVTAEKQNSFLTIIDGGMILDFSGKHLIKGEQDASSFPNGGLRVTFEARGYTAWDCTSPAFIREDALGPTLIIPTAFCAYTGESLDKKTPLLRSMQAINDQGLRILRLLGNRKSKHVTPMVGAEQEYFLVDREKCSQRKDLTYTGHTLFGAMPPKGQELDDHYAGLINEKVGAFMKDLNTELWKLGVPATTQHNEVAPSQHEMAPLYEQCNVATDHNQITMEIMKRVADEHDMVCLLHEKPFANINGSGKHNNWSLSTDDGINFMKPGKEPHSNKLFLLTVACVLAAVDDHADLLRYAAANAGNDLRLGGNEAPPTVVSVFLGEQLDDVIEQLLRTGTATKSKKGGKLLTGVSVLPEFEKDATDRNRTSPFAFTGNKFEFRMLGSSDSIASPNIVLNTIVAEAFKNAADEIEKAEDIDQAVTEYTKKLFIEHERIIFNGDGYSKEWEKEAARRGLPNLPSMVDAIPAITKEKAIKLFEEFGVFTEAELISRAEIEYNAYANEIGIEARTMIDMAGKQIIPAVSGFLGSLASSALKVREACPGADTSTQEKMLKECSGLLADTSGALEELSAKLASVGKVKGAAKRARAYRDKIVPAMKKLREPVDRLEMLVDKNCWPMPSYGDLIF